MPEWIYEVRGRLVDLDGAPVEGIRMAVLAGAQPEVLIAIGSPAKEGRFNLSFTTSAFASPAHGRFEPSLRLLFGALDERRQWRSFCLLPVEASCFHSFVAEVGALTLPMKNQRASHWLPGPFPPPRPAGQIMALDQLLVQHAIGEALSVVEQATGYQGLGAQVSAHLADDLGEGSGPAGVTFGGTTFGGLTRRLRLALFHENASGMYHHERRQILIHRPVAERNNLDNLKIVIGHELVHAGQYLAHPELSASEPRGTSELDRLRRSANTEGYAYYIEQDHLAEAFPLGVDLPAPEPSARSLAAAWGLRLLAPERAVGAADPELQRRWRFIHHATQIYRDRAALLGQPAPFDLSVAASLTD